MAFRYNKIGTLVAEDPAAAHKRLTALFERYQGNMQTLSQQLGVNRATVFRWVNKLIAAGYGDPRGDQRGSPGRVSTNKVGVKKR